MKPYKSNFLFIMVMMLFVGSKSWSTTFSCTDVLSSKTKSAELLRFEAQDLLFLEMAAASVVFRMINKEVLKVAKDGKIDLTASQVSAVNTELYEAFDAIFSRDNIYDRRMNYINAAQRKANTVNQSVTRRFFNNFLSWFSIRKIKSSNLPGFNFERLKKLYKTNPDYVHLFLKKNQTAILVNARSMSHIKLSSIADKYFSPGPANRRVTLGLYGIATLAFFGPLVYDLNENIRYIDDYFVVMMLESSSYALSVLSLGNAFRLFTVPFNSLWLTIGAPKYDTVNYKDGVGSEVRSEFVDTFNSESLPLTE